MSLHIDVVSEHEWGASVGARLAQRLAATPGQRLCLPTGDTPRTAYQAFAAEGGNFEATEVFLLDEFGLPEGHPARCDVMLARSLLDHLSLPLTAVHTIDVSAEPIADECARYEALVDDGGLDLTLLGLGDNGHLGLNEPGTPSDSPTRVVQLHEATIRNAASYGDGAAPAWGVTLGLRPLLASREIWLLVTGAHKADILRRALHGPIGPDVPASYLQGHPNTTVLADDAAAALLSEE